MRLGPFDERSFRLLFTSRAVSSLGNRLAPVALAFAVLNLTGSVSALGLVLGAQMGPLVALVLWGGVWADRLSRQRVMMIADATRGAAQAASALLLLIGPAHIWELVCLQAIYGAAEGFFAPAAQGLVPQVVHAEHLQQANSLLALGENAASILGPAVAGVIVAAAGAGWGLAADAMTFGVSALALSQISIARPARESVTARGIRVELREGWSGFRSRTWLWASVLYFALFLAFVNSALLVLGPQVARLRFGGAWAWAGIAAALGVGAVGGGLVGLRIRPVHPLRVGFGASLASGPLLFVLLGMGAYLPVILFVATIEGGAQTLFNALWYTAVQSDVPSGEVSRVSSWDYLGSNLLQPAGLAIVGPVSALVGLSAALYGAGVLFFVLLLCVLSIPAVRGFAIEDRPSAVARDEAHVADLTPGTLTEQA